MSISAQVRKYAEEHPDASRKEIAEALGCKLGTVSYALRDKRVDGPITVEELRQAREVCTSLNKTPRDAFDAVEFIRLRSEIFGGIARMSKAIDELISIVDGDE